MALPRDTYNRQSLGLPLNAAVKEVSKSSIRLHARASRLHTPNRKRTRKRRAHLIPHFYICPRPPPASSHARDGASRIG